MEDVRAELSEMLDEAAWEWLIPHAKRDAIVVVDADLDLLDVGVAIANDQVATVQQWITEQRLAKPTQQQLSDWGNDLTTHHFMALIVQPYVLVQEKAI